jgi:hypothetical protein
VDRVHGAWTGWRGSGPRWTGRGADKRCDGASLVHGVRALRLVEAHQQGGRGGGCEAIGGHTVGEEVVWRWFDDGVFVRRRRNQRGCQMAQEENGPAWCLGQNQRRVFKWI